MELQPTEWFIDQAMRLIARGLAARRLETVVTGLENIPARGPALIAARHYHHLYDGLAFFAALERRFHIVVTVDWVRTRRMKIVMEALNRLARWPMVLRADALASESAQRATLFFPRDIVRYRLAALRQSVRLLAAGRLVVIFPEAYPNIDPTYTAKREPEDFLPFQAGFATIARAAERHIGRDIPIIPAGLQYEQGKICTANLRFGAALYGRRFADRQELVHRTEENVRVLCGLPAS